MAKILMVYQSKYGQTEKIAKFIAEQMRVSGHSVELLNVENESRANLQSFDAFIVGGALYGQKFPKKLVRWVSHHQPSMERKPSAFFGVCLAALQRDPKVQMTLDRIAQKFMAKTLWTPNKQAFFAGALSYSKYSWLTKQMMKLISRSQAGPTDVSHDYEFTDWNEVSMFTRDFTYILPLVKTSRDRPLSL